MKSGNTSAGPMWLEYWVRWRAVWHSRWLRGGFLATLFVAIGITVAARNRPPVASMGSPLMVAGLIATIASAALHAWWATREKEALLRLTRMAMSACMAAVALAILAPTPALAVLAVGLAMTVWVASYPVLVAPEPRI